MQFFLGDESISIGQAVADTTAAHKVGSVELSLLAKKDYRGCTDDDLLANGRQLRSFVDACPDTFSCLTRLKLESLVLFPSVFTKICTICKRLDFLHLFNIEMGVPSLLEVQHPQLRELEIAKCGFERVDLNWLPKLTTQRRRTSSSPAPSCAVSGTQSAGAFPLMRMCAGCSPTTPPRPVAQRRPRLSPSSSAGIFGSTVMG
jgi:hypothetical protein